MVFIDQLGAWHGSALGLGAQVDVDFRARAAGAGIAHLPEIVVLVAVDDMVGRQMLLPDGGSLVVAAQALGGRAFKYSGIQAARVQPDYIHQKLPCPVDSLSLEIVAKRPVAQHLKHRMVIRIVADLLKVIMLAAHAQTLLRVSHTTVFCRLIAKDDILKLVHAGVGKHQRRVILDYHRGRRHDMVAFALEKVLERLAYFFGGKHFI